MGGEVPMGGEPIPTKHNPADAPSRGIRPKRALDALPPRRRSRAELAFDRLERASAHALGHFREIHARRCFRGRDDCYAADTEGFVG